jgi:hypothetical protein
MHVMQMKDNNMPLAQNKSAEVVIDLCRDKAHLNVTASISKTTSSR